MCGIVGGNTARWNYEKALNVICHRGPDRRDIYRGNEFFLGFARLAIIDLSPRAMQPMVDESGKVRIVYNGEIYSYKNLRRKLEQNYTFRTASDTEVVLAAYLQYGDKFIQYIDGIYAIAIYDERVKKVKLYRDRVGVKPLYYYYDGYNFAFCSELKGILALECQQKWEIDHTALYDYLTYQYIPEPKSLYHRIFKLQPAHWIEYEIPSGRLSKQCCYWKLKINDKQFGSVDIDEAAYELKRIIRNSVKQQLNADVAVGTFLSGGIDSSIVVDEARKQYKDILAFSVGFQDGRYSESQYAQKVARHLDVKLVEGICSRETLMNIYGKIKQWFDEPFADTSCYPTYMVCGLAKEKVRVVLTGDGGDELFGGYQHYGYIEEKRKGKNNRKVSSFYQHIGIKIEKLEDYLLEDLALYAKYTGFVLNKSEKSKYAKKWGIPKDYDDYWFLRKFYHRDLPMRTRLQYMDFHTFLRRVLTKVDRTSMQNSIEARVPLLSRKVIEYAFGLPENIRYFDGELKGILKYAYQDELPNDILYRQKQGFNLPPQYLQRVSLPQQIELLQNIWNL